MRAALLALTFLSSPALLLAQSADEPTTPVGALAYAALLPVVGWIAGKLYDGLKTVIPALDKAPAIVHQVLAPLLQFAFGWVSAATGAAVLTGLDAIDAGWIGGILTTLLAAGIKRWEKSKAPADATVVLENTRASSAVRR
jgi:hypothetical protein